MSKKMVRSDAVDFLNDQGVPMTYPTLTNWGRSNKGPSFERIGRLPVYDEESLQKYADEWKAKRKR